MMVVDRSSCLSLVPEGCSTVMPAAWHGDGVGILPIFGHPAVPRAREGPDGSILEQTTADVAPFMPSATAASTSEDAGGARPSAAGSTKGSSPCRGISSNGLKWDLSPGLDLRFGGIVSSSNCLGERARTDGVQLDVPAGATLVWSADVLPLAMYLESSTVAVDAPGSTKTAV